MERKLTTFFNRSDTYSLPSQWATEPLPTAPVKRPVGRPKKRLCTDEATSSTTEMNADVSAAVTVPVHVDAIELPALAEQHVANSCLLELVYGYPNLYLCLCERTLTG